MTFLDRSRWQGKIFTTGGWVAGSGGEYDAVEPAKFPKCVPRFLNERWAERVGLDLDAAGWASCRRRHGSA